MSQSESPATGLLREVNMLLQTPLSPIQRAHVLRMKTLIEGICGNACGLSILVFNDHPIERELVSLCLKTEFPQNKIQFCDAIPSAQELIEQPALFILAEENFFEKLQMLVQSLGELSPPVFLLSEHEKPSVAHFQFVQKPFTVDKAKCLRKQCSLSCTKQCYTEHTVCEIDPKLQILNSEILSQLTDGQSDVLKDLIAFFFDNMPSQIDTLRKEIEAKNWGSVKHIAHKIKGSAASYGAQRLQFVTAQIEQLASKEETATIPDLFSLTVQEFETFCAALKSWNTQ